MTPRICGLQMKILAVVLRGDRPTIDAITQECRCSPGAVIMHLRALRKLGLVSWEDRKHRTILPTCRLMRV